MKKKTYKIFLMIVMLILPVSVHALTGSISISCTPTEVKAGSEVTCIVNGTASSPGITQFEFILSLSDEISLKDQREEGDDEPVNFILKNSWQGDSDVSDGKVSGYRDNPTNETFKIGEFKVVVSDSASAGDKTITISNVKYSYDADDSPEDGVPYDIEGTSTKITVKEDEPTPEKTPDLKSLTVTSGGTLNQAFSTENSSYILTLTSAEVTKFKLSVEAEDSEFTISAKNTDSGETIDLTKDITYEPDEDKETMSITITVSFGDKKKEYVVLVTRPKPSTVGSPTPASLIVGGQTVNLKSGQFDYSVYLSSSVLENYVVKAVLEDDENFKFDDYTMSLIDTEMSGVGDLTITIIPKDSNSGYGSETYTIKIMKKDSGGTPSSSKPSSTKQDVNESPDTGGSAIVIGIMLILSFILSIYYYKKNINGYN